MLLFLFEFMASVIWTEEENLFLTKPSLRYPCSDRPSVPCNLRQLSERPVGSLDPSEAHRFLYIGTVELCRSYREDRLRPIRERSFVRSISLFGTGETSATAAPSAVAINAFVGVKSGLKTHGGSTVGRGLFCDCGSRFSQILLLFSF